MTSTNMDIADVISAYNTWLHQAQNDECPQSEKELFMAAYSHRKKVLLRHIADAETLLMGVEPTTDPNLWKPIVEGSMTFNVKGIQDNLASLRKSLDEIEEMYLKTNR